MLLCGILLWLLPVACEVWRGMSYRLRPTLLALAAALLAVVTLPGWLLPPALLWCAASAALMWLDEADPLRRGLLWAVVTVLSGLLVLALTSAHYPDGIADGVADSLLRRISASSDPISVLVSAWRYGLARVPGDTLYPYFSLVGGQTYIDTEAVLQLTLSLRLTLRNLVVRLLPTLTVHLVALPPILAPCLGELVESRHSGFQLLKPFRLWALPRWPVLALGMIALGQWFVQSPFGQALTALCAAAWGLAALIEGLAVARYDLDRQEISSGWAVALLVVMTLLLGTAVRIIGTLDLIFDFRALRRESTRS